MTDKTGLSKEQAAEIVKKKRGAKWTQELTETGSTDIEPGENSRFVRYAMASMHLPPIDISDPAQVQKRIDEYFQFCIDNDRRPQIVGLCNWLGISRQAMNEWKNGDVRKSTHGDMIKKVYSVMEEMWTDYMQYGRISPPTAIFLAKNWFNYKDVADIVVTPNNPLQDLDETEARKRILDALPEPDETD